MSNIVLYQYTRIDFFHKDYTIFNEIYYTSSKYQYQDYSNSFTSANTHWEGYYKVHMVRIHSFVANLINGLYR